MSIAGTRRRALALEGGEPVRTAPLPPWPSPTAGEIAAASRVLSSGRLNYWTGDEGRRFEQSFAERAGVPYAVALANGTVALEAALASLEVGEGDEVVVPARTFIATASAVARVGAIPMVADVDADTGGLSAATVAGSLTARTRAVIAVHLGGRPVDAGPLLALLATRGIPLIEDCAQALGATYRGREAGSIGAVGCFSFCQDKIMTTGGEGGMLVTSDEGVFRRAWSLKDHGKLPEARAGTQTAGVAFRWLHDSFGTNWRMTEVQAAIGLEGLRLLPEWLERRRANAAALADGLSRMPALRVPQAPRDVESACYRFYAFVDPRRLRTGWDRDTVAAAVTAEGIPCAVGSCPEIHRERAFEGLPGRPDMLPVARRLGETSLAFLVHPTLGEAEMADTVDAVAKVLEVASL